MDQQVSEPSPVRRNRTYVTTVRLHPAGGGAEPGIAALRLELLPALRTLACRRWCAAFSPVPAHPIAAVLMALVVPALPIQQLLKGGSGFLVLVRRLHGA